MLRKRRCKQDAVAGILVHTLIRKMQIRIRSGVAWATVVVELKVSMVASSATIVRMNFGIASFLESFDLGAHPPRLNWCNSCSSFLC